MDLFVKRFWNCFKANHPSIEITARLPLPKPHKRGTGKCISPSQRKAEFELKATIAINALKSEVVSHVKGSLGTRNRSMTIREIREAGRTEKGVQKFEIFLKGARDRRLLEFMKKVPAISTALREGHGVTLEYQKTVEGEDEIHRWFASSVK